MFLMAKELKRLNINMPVELVERIDRYAKNLSINRTAAINLLVSISLHKIKDSKEERMLL